MEGIKMGFRQSFGTVAALGLLGLVLGFVFIPLSARAATVEMSVSPGTINPGDTAILHWSTEGVDQISISPGIGSVGTFGSKFVSPSQTTTYTLSGSKPSGEILEAHATVRVEDDDEDPTVNISASPGTICPGSSSTLSWTSSNADTVSINQGIGSVSKNSSTSVSPNQTTTYTITATNGSGNAQASATVNIRSANDCDGGGDLPTVNLRADDTSIDDGDETELTWTSTNADYCVRTGGRNGWSDDRVGTSGDFDTDELHSDTTYRITCHNDVGSANDSVTVRVDDDDDNNDRVCRDRDASNYNRSWPCRFPTPTGNPPTVTVFADQTSVAFNGATFVRWNTFGATSCFASGGSTGWSGAKPIGPGSFYTGSLASSRTYTLTCYNSYGSDTDSVTVGVRPSTGGPTPPRPTGTSLVLVTSTIDRNQPIVPTLDNTRPRPGDEITYTVTYQNIGTAAITNLVLRLDLPFEVNYLQSTPSNPIISGNTLIFNLGTLRANGSGTVTVRVRVREEAAPGALLNFPAVLSYIDPAGLPQTVSANVSAQVWTNPVPVEEVREGISLAAAVFGANGDFFPDTLFGWLLLILLILLLVAIVRHLMVGGTNGFSRKTTTTTVQH